MNSLVIGNTSQLAYYFPDEYEKISSRDINFDHYNDNFYDRIYFCFAEQRTFLNKSDLFYDINVTYTIELIEFFKNKCNNIVIYGTCELWNKCSGAVRLDIPFDYELHTN